MKLFHISILCLLAGCLMIPRGACALDSPWVSDVFFYWYTWDYENELGGWMGGVHNTPLYGYYDSRTFKDNKRSLWLASEWGITHHFMDYWDPNWKGEGGEMREKIVMRAAEALRKEGYDIWIAYYQDGTNFEMKEFSKNFSEKRDVYQWIRDFASSPVWPKINGYPLQLVYGRNGRPETTIDNPGFRKFLKGRYKDVKALNKQWGTAFKSFDELAMDFSAKGQQRTFSIKYQYEIWRKEWEKLNGLIKNEFSIPGMLASFDVAYQPFGGFGYCDFARVFGGPHSYGGIFGQPHDQDIERFIQSIVAKKYNTVFLDHFKNYYHDWEIRIPGTAYLPDPYNFDRFWVGDLMRYNEAILHLSWNEWWEGSNLEPCYEFGKTYPEKNLFYATIMKQCFPAIKNWADGARVAVILNDWNFLAGGVHPQEMYQTVQSLRKLNVKFDLIPDDFVTEKTLAPFTLVIAPACGTGFGYNAKREPIADVLWKWRQGGKGRKLVVSSDDTFRSFLGLKESATPEGAPTARGDDMNVFVDVGVAGDNEFLVEGCSNRENWGKLPEGAFGAGTGLTVRWTPASGKVTTFILPASPGRDHVVRLSGSAIWANTVTVKIDNAVVGSFDVKAGVNEYEVAAPAKAIGANKIVELQLVYQTARVPMKEDPKRFPGEGRVCNLGINWIQFATDNMPARSTEQKYEVPAAQISFDSEIYGLMDGMKIDANWSRHRMEKSERADAKVLSTYTADGAPRDIVIGDGVIYVNGLFDDISGADYWRNIINNWAKIPVTPYIADETEDVMSSKLETGDTDILLAYNYDISDAGEPSEGSKPSEGHLSEAKNVQIRLPKRSAPLSEAVALSKDGAMYGELTARVEGSEVEINDSFRYYAVYQFAFSPVRVKTPELVIHPGETKRFAVEAANISDRAVEGQIRVVSIIPTIQSEPVGVSLAAGDEKQIELRISAKDTIDWGRKTIVLELSFGGRKACLWRELLVERNPDVRLLSKIVDARNPMIRVANVENGFITNGAALNLTASIGAAKAVLGDIGSGGEIEGKLLELETPTVEKPTLLEKTLSVDYLPQDGAKTATHMEHPIFIAVAPKTFPQPADAVQPVVVYNHLDHHFDHELIEIDLSDLSVKAVGRAATLPVDAKRLYVREQGGNIVPSQVDFKKKLCFVALVPPKSAATFYVCKRKQRIVKPPTDLKTEAKDLGSKRGRLTVRNSLFSITLDEKSGGTAISFRSAASGRDYGRNSFGLNYGQFSKHDPATPRTTTVEFIHESKTRQYEKPAKIRILAQGPVRTIAEVQWKDKRVKSTQIYEFRAYQDYFILDGQIEPIELNDVQELVALDTRFTANALFKTYPNFVGIQVGPDEAKPHFGWRRGGWVPDYLTLMTPNQFEESISLILTEKAGLDHVRQGFWPKERPKPGKREVAQIELVSMEKGPVDFRAYVKLHQGYQIVAKRFLQDLNSRPLVVLPENWEWSGKMQAKDSKVASAWRAFSPFWHYRAPINVSWDSTEGTEKILLEIKIDLDKILGEEELDPASVRVMEISEGDELSCQEKPSSYDAGAGVLCWWASGIDPKGGRKRFCVYFDSLANGPKSASKLSNTFLMRELRGVGFEGDASGWKFENAEIAQGDGRGGGNAVRLRLADDGPSLAANQLLAVAPNDDYKLTFWAKVVKGPALVRTNFYQGADYDFSQIGINLTDDGEWHRYEATVPTGSFPPEIKPMLRLWTLGKAQEILVDDVSVKPLKSMGVEGLKVEIED